MILMKGDVFKADCDYFGVTTNSIIKRNGELVMGAGVAKSAMLLNPELPKIFGADIVGRGLVGGYYGIIKPSGSSKYFTFQTKRHYKDKSNITDVIMSINQLKEIAIRFHNKTFALPFPAIANGGLKRGDVLPYLLELPNNVYVYEL